MVCAPLHSGGLAIRSLRNFNKLLFGKWLWRFGNERQALWMRVIGIKYDCEGGGLVLSSPYQPSWSEFVEVYQPWLAFFRLSHPICGWGWVLVRFWQDIWCGDTLLILSYPELFVVSRSKETCVADLRRFSNGVLFWDLNFVRAIQDWELESLSNFLDSIYGVSLKGVGTIRIIGILIKEEVLQFTHITRF